MELRPGYRELAPPAALRGALACVWVRVAPHDGAAATRVLPDACVDLVWRPGQGAFVAGPDTGPVVVPVTPGSVTVGARFLPGAGGPALGLPMSELRDLRVDVASLLPELAEELPGDLSPDAALSRVAAVAACLAATGAPDAAARAAARRLSDPRARVEELAGELGLSERQLRRRCHAAVGYGPKMLQRALRFRTFLARADAAGAEADLARIAAEVGYADQAHLSRECTRLAGLAPAALLRERAAAGP